MFDKDFKSYMYAVCMYAVDPDFTPFFNIKYIIAGRYKPDLLLDVRNICYTLIHTPYNLSNISSLGEAFDYYIGP